MRQELRIQPPSAICSLRVGGLGFQAYGFRVAASTVLNIQLNAQLQGLGLEFVQELRTQLIAPQDSVSRVPQHPKTQTGYCMLSPYKLQGV